MPAPRSRKAPNMDRNSQVVCWAQNAFEMRMLTIIAMPKK